MLKPIKELMTIPHIYFLREIHFKMMRNLEQVFMIKLKRELENELWSRKEAIRKLLK